MLIDDYIEYLFYASTVLKIKLIEITPDLILD